MEKFHEYMIQPLWMAYQYPRQERGKGNSKTMLMSDDLNILSSWWSPGLHMTGKVKKEPDIKHKKLGLPPSVGWKLAPLLKVYS